MTTTLTENMTLQNTTRTNKYYEELKKLNKNDSNIIIEPAVVKAALENGDMSVIDSHPSNRLNVNVYYRLNRIDNTALAMIRNRMYILLSENVYCEEKKKFINVVDELKEFSWSIQSTSESGNRKHPMASTPKRLKVQGYAETMYMHRVITSLELYGEVRQLDSTYDVHHKGACYDDRQGITMYIPKELHKHRESHCVRTQINNYDDFNRFIIKAKEDYDRLLHVTEIR